jgi:type I restriction enzyme R subunit
MVDHREIAFESAIIHSLTTSGGYEQGDPKLYDRTRALHPQLVLSFVQSTQPRQWQAIADYYGANAPEAFLSELAITLDSRGTLDVLRHGLDFFGQTFALAYFAPASGLNPDTAKLYDANRLTVTRQVHFSLQQEQSIDLLLSVNGLPVATVELKNAFTRQIFKNAIRQYKERDPRELLFSFKKRALVHFAVDTDECYMATRLEGSATRFLPFNKGNHGGAGNPENPNGYRTYYLWEQIWKRDSWLDLLGRFLHIEKLGGQESLIFPRYHQVDAVRKLIADARTALTGKNYLVWHSAGSGKSNSIAWLAHRLSSLHDAENRKVFDSVIVITDRLVLDKQLQDTIYQFEHKTGVVMKIEDDSKQLAEALRTGVPIIITILQKFPFVTKHAGDLPERRYAVIVDEAHSSQSGESAAKMKAVLAGERIRAIARQRAEDEQLPDYEEEIIRVVEGRKQQPNLSFFAFTATPKYKTIEVFGQRGANGQPQPFHEYSMRQAIEEGFILDVLKNYTVYSTYYRLLKAAQEDPEVEKKKAAKALARFMRLHPHNIAQKTEVIIEHFRENVRHRIGGRAKAMVVTGSRLEAVRYKKAADEYIQLKRYDLRTLVAFSGSLVDPDDPNEEELTEVKMNGGKINEKNLPEEFKKPEYGILIAADKYQTGFDQPLLHTMYVDKRLADVQAVQTLSRLNRMYPGKEDTFVLDFVNEPEEIQRAFQRYYDTAPIITGVPDARQLYALRSEMYGTFIVQEIEVEQFAAVFFKPRLKESPTDHALMHSIADKAVGRFLEASGDGQEEFRNRLDAFRRLYSFLSQVIPFGDSKLEKFDAYLRFLETKFPVREGTGRLNLDDDVKLKFYRLQKISEGRIALEPGTPGALKGPSDVGTGRVEDEQVPLSRVVDVLNDRFGTEFTSADELFWDQVRADATADESVRDAGEANTIDNFAHVFDRRLEELVIGRMDRNSGQVVRFLDNPEVREFITRLIRNQVYAGIQRDAKSRAEA